MLFKNRVLNYSSPYLQHNRLQESPIRSHIFFFRFRSFVFNTDHQQQHQQQLPLLSFSTRGFYEIQLISSFNYRRSLFIIVPFIGVRNMCCDSFISAWTYLTYYYVSESIWTVSFMAPSLESRTQLILHISNIQLLKKYWLRSKRKI